MPKTLIEYIAEYIKLLEEQRKNKKYQDHFSVKSFIKALNQLRPELNFGSVWPKTIFLIGLNYPDGIGDFINLLEISTQIKAKAAGKSNIHLLSVVTKSKAGLAKFIADQHDRTDCKFIVIPDDINIVRCGQLKTETRDLIQTGLDQHFLLLGKQLNQSTLVLNVAAVSDDLISTVMLYLSGYTRSSIPHFTLAELSKTKTNDKKFIAMGLTDDEAGVKLPAKSTGSTNNLLCLSNRNLLAQILNADLALPQSKLQQIADRYSKTTQIRYGYLQSVEAVALFIKTTVVECRSDDKTLDFFIKPAQLDIKFFDKKFCAANGIARICHYDGNSWQKFDFESNSGTKTMRVFSLSNVEQNDLEIFHTLSAKMIGGSGDSSMLTAIFGSDIPFLQIRSWKQKFIGDFIGLIYDRYGECPLLRYFLCLSYAKTTELNITNKMQLHDELAYTMADLLAKHCGEMKKMMRAIVNNFERTCNLEDNLELIILQAMLRRDELYNKLEDAVIGQAKGHKDFNEGVAQSLVKTLLILAYGLHELRINKNKTEFIDFINDMHAGYEDSFKATVILLAERIAKKSNFFCLADEVQATIPALIEGAVIQSKVDVNSELASVRPGSPRYHSCS